VNLEKPDLFNQVVDDFLRVDGGSWLPAIREPARLGRRPRDRAEPCISAGL
jgi:hypothetical protein